MSSRHERDESFRRWLQNSLTCQFSVRVTDLEELATSDLEFPVRFNRYLVTIMRPEYPLLFGRVANRHNNIAYFHHLHLTNRAEMRP